MTAAVYGARTVKRSRRTNDQIADLDAAIVAAIAEDAPVTLRGVYYRCVSAGAVDKTELGYKAVGRRLLDLRRQRIVSYWDITDGTRWVLKPTTFNGIDEALRDAAASYRRTLWATSDYRLQLFSEKDAITGVIDAVTAHHDVALGVLRGYASESFCWRVAASLDPHRVNVLGQLGDHDPSGVGAWEDFQRKVTGFAPDRTVWFDRLAVTVDQIDEYNLPLRPTKQSDGRARGWVGGSVEVDAIPARDLRSIVTGWIERHIDPHALLVAREAEQSERDVLTRLAGGWSE